MLFFFVLLYYWDHIIASKKKKRGGGLFLGCPVDRFLQGRELGRDDDELVQKRSAEVDPARLLSVGGQPVT